MKKQPEEQQRKTKLTQEEKTAARNPWIDGLIDEVLQQKISEDSSLTYEKYFQELTQEQEQKLLNKQEDDQSNEMGSSGVLGSDLLLIPENKAGTTVEVVIVTKAVATESAEKTNDDKHPPSVAQTRVENIDELYHQFIRKSKEHVTPIKARPGSQGVNVGCSASIFSPRTPKPTQASSSKGMKEIGLLLLIMIYHHSKNPRLTEIGFNELVAESFTAFNYNIKQHPFWAQTCLQFSNNLEKSAVNKYQNILTDAQKAVFKKTFGHKNKVFGAVTKVCNANLILKQALQPLPEQDSAEAARPTL